MKPIRPNLARGATGPDVTCTWRSPEAQLLLKSVQSRAKTNKLDTDKLAWSFGDALVSIEGYPIKVVPPTGIMQLVACESVN
ncbi:MAG TPA: hypothetical protein VNA16_10375, partial [Abditibacteriaceae bacterium]|nr:hypothetical protein [Abditibacteriaceae bacterium]